MHSRTPTLDRYVRAAEALAKRTGRAAASRAQIAFAVSLAYGARVPDTQRIHTLATLKRGVSGPHCGLLIRRLRPYRQNADTVAPSPTDALVSPRVEESCATSVPGVPENEELPPEDLFPLDDEMALVSAFGTSDDNDHHHPFL